MVIALLLVSAASAAGITVTLSPDTTGAHSTLHVSAQGSPSQSSSSLPKSVALLIARGFRVDPRATKRKCRSAGSSPCPARSTIGSGQAIVHVSTSVGYGSGDYNVAFKLFLGPPRQSGDIASVVMQGSTAGNSFTTVGRLFKVASGPYGLELEIDVPQEHAPSGITISGYLKQLTMTVGTARKVTSHHGARKRSHVYALITNARTCTGGSWPGELVENFSDGSSQSLSFAAPCRAG